MKKLQGSNAELTNNSCARISGLNNCWMTQNFMLEHEAYSVFCNNEGAHASSFCVSAFVYNVLNMGHHVYH